MQMRAADAETPTRWKSCFNGVRCVRKADAPEGMAVGIAKHHAKACQNGLRVGHQALAASLVDAGRPGLDHGAFYPAQAQGDGSRQARRASADDQRFSFGWGNYGEGRHGTPFRRCGRPVVIVLRTECTTPKTIAVSVMSRQRQFLGKTVLSHEGQKRLGEATVEDASLSTSH